MVPDHGRVLVDGTVLIAWLKLQTNGQFLGKIPRVHASTAQSEELANQGELVHDSFDKKHAAPFCVHMRRTASVV